ncbi:MAG: hypothetical protein ABFS34_07970 [Gemmatimonadota bacterium]
MEQKEGRTVRFGTPSVLALCPDLLFASKIRGAGAAAGVPVQLVRNQRALMDALEAEAEAEAAAAEGAPAPGRRLVLVDLGAAHDGAEAVGAAKQGFPDVEVVAFAPHVAADRIQAARAAGADVVLARSAFIVQLPGMLRALKA